MDADQDAAAAGLRAAEQLGHRLVEIDERARQGRPRGFRLPELDADPDAGDLVPGMLWLLADGRLRWRTSDDTTYEYDPNDAGAPPPGGGSSGVSKPADPRPVKRTRTWAPTWSRSYCPRHGAESGDRLYYGDSVYSRSHGFRRIHLGFDDAAIRAALSGAVIRAVFFRMRNAHAHYHSGVTVHFGGHNRSAPGTGYGSVRESVARGHWPKVGFGREWRRVPSWFGAQLRDGNIRGVTIRQPGPASQFYGAMDPASFRIRIVYTK